MIRNCLGAALVALTAGAGWAQDYPVPTITLVTHSSPGAGGDVFLREMAKVLSPALGATVVVENVPGGSSAKALAYVAQAPADGSVIYGTTPTFVYTSLLSNPEFSYKDIDPLVNVFEDPEVLFTAANSGFETLEDVIAKARDGRGRWGAANPASLERQSMEMLKAAAEVKAGIVTHEGGGDMMINVLNGSLDMGVGEMQELSAQVEAGEVKLLAVLSEERLADYPDLPTVKESGYDVAVRKFRGVAGPKNLPPEVIAAWEAAIPKLLDSQEFKDWYATNSLIPAFMPQEEYRTFIEGFATETGDFLRSSGVIN
ncbi:Bug family tripartite tricarboxylate transporter substrate binding protein [Cereibacter johrii]|uniref:Bug family tripartite tricarboxylate transporter substrate binding protein n=1 Tax=Cereibacter johrii TaxID=445629 RepID=UPI000DCEAE7F|nr:tripartite tricarboxylate transporter substrate binding protein [Cereibacter johrii]RAZ85229.1 tripartite tricarboxylate transporter substrate binding protein [Cereibacter johrii]